MLAGELGGMSAAVLLGSRLELSSRDASIAAVGSAIGASVAGGSALVSERMKPRVGAGLMMGGTALGLAGGALLASRLDFGGSGVQAGALGGLLGLSEALAFAWAGRTERAAGWSGAGLIGAGVGTTLGLAAVASPLFSSAQGPAAAGFAAWGAWTGAFAGALANPDAHEATLGGLLGANVGFLAGYGLTRAKAIDPGDFGWISLFGAIGTIAGAGVSAPFSTKTDARPILAGLSAGPVLGMLAGAFVLPKLRAMRDSAPSSAPSLPPAQTPPAAAPSGAHGRAAPPEEPVDRVAAIQPESRADAHQPALLRSEEGDLLGAMSQLVEVADWAPTFGAMPSPLSSTSAPMFQVGVTGRLW